MNPYTDYLHDETLLILLFHGVILRHSHAVRNYTHKHISRETFVKILRSFKTAGGVPLSMAEVLKHHCARTPWPLRAYAVTFDDGFANNHTIAAPILDDLKIPATFYVTSQFVNEGACSWIDQIEYAVEQDAVCKLHLPDWGVHGEHRTVEAKRELLVRIRKEVKSNSKLDPYEVAAEVWRQLAVEGMDLDEDLDLKMNWEQVQDLERHPRFTVGGHGHTHRILSHLNESDLERELDENFRLLTTHLQGPIEHYSYPEGLKSCYSPTLIKALKNRGVECCPSAETGTNRRDENLFELKRVMVT